MFRDAPPPPVIFSQPVVDSQALGPIKGRPVYWYLPPGQVRKWATYCGKYAACDVPVYFVRMDDNPASFRPVEETRARRRTRGIRARLGRAPS